MPLARAIPRAIVILLGLTLAACETAFDSPPPRAPEPVAEVVAPEPQTFDVAPTPQSAPAGSTARMPSEIRSGFAEMVIQRVEREISRAEVETAVQTLLTEEPICLPFPALWLEGVTRNTFVVRFDLMARDWGESAVAAAQARMGEFVGSGFLSQRDRPEVNARAVEYTVTPAGRARMRGVLDGGHRPTFCAPAERRLVEITNMEWGQYPCGSLRVRFTHVSDDWPSWARSDATRQRLAADWPPIGETAYGAVSFSRQWYRSRDLPPGAVNGALRSVCYDAGRERVIGDDLDLAAPAE